MERNDDFDPRETGVFLKELEFADSDTMARLAGKDDENIDAVEQRYPVRLIVRGQRIAVRGPDSDAVNVVYGLLQQLHTVAGKGHSLLLADVRYAMDMITEKGEVNLTHLFSEVICTTARGKPIRAKTEGQRNYLKAIRSNHIVFTIGPAGTGKTYLAVCHAVSLLKASAISRIVLVRPAVEAGESLGYLPGDLREKVEPYVRPLYDAFYELLSPERFLRYVDKGVIEIAPLAYMRGRTLNDSFIILDEAQNTTPEQMKMFLTRLGFGSKAVITGDVTQIDLPTGKMSGLKQVREILQDIDGIEFFYLTHVDVVRHEIVQQVVKAYERYDEQRERNG
ncbi:MAG: PhoH family protein [Synergistaceae bacterium]|nr:PhoH family protein [Synergistaceae bacterium]